MPIKKHVVRVETNSKGKPCIEIPKSICDALAIADGTVVKLYSNKDSYSFKVETMLSYENANLLEDLRKKNEQLKQALSDAKTELEKLKRDIGSVANKTSEEQE